MQQTQARRNHIARTQGEHCHDFPQLLLGWRGEMECAFDRESRRLCSSTAAVVPANTRHHFAGCDDRSELLVVDLSSVDSCLTALEEASRVDFVGRLFSNSGFFEMPPVMVSTINVAVEQLRFFGSHDPHHLLRRQLAMMFVTQVYELMEFGSDNALPRERRFSLDEINAFIDASLETPPSNAALADFMHLGQSQLHMLFLRHFGKTPQQYVLQRRLQWAMTWLQTTRLSLGRIAMDLGFSDNSSFSRAFRRHFGYPPSTIKKKSC
ncbi:AraC family transcriptional regulator [Chromohalobacter nigrandesensis]|uniref:AraC family transcriptional regulator n=1 Tax=Chromohalobacter nigrandesensis TaxID=119863 RepID=UPI001FF2D09E|nr:AraC family transcriptional regulator [Chromohalobacter nigrandesensis]MCK0744338.1 AraC family transcriptional regulator [Chromohalobacter nigrandesensis]